MSDRELPALREEMRQRLHPITCRICRQELTYFRDVGRFPLEEREVQGAYLAGRGYRFLLTVWWGRVADHLPMDLKEMPAVSSYYRHMSFHLGIRTERDPSTEEDPTDFLARSGGFTTSPEPSVPVARTLPAPAPAPVPSTPPEAPKPPAFPTFVSVPVPENPETGGWAPARVEASHGERSVLRLAKTMVRLNELSNGKLPSSGALGPDRAAAARQARPEGWAARGGRTELAPGGYALRTTGTPEPRRRRAPSSSS